MKFEWEKISESVEIGSVMKTFIAPVFGGWLIRQSWWIEDDNENESNSISITFMPDPSHQWEITT